MKKTFFYLSFLSLITSASAIINSAHASPFSWSTLTSVWKNTSMVTQQRSLESPHVITPSISSPVTHQKPVHQSAPQNTAPKWSVSNFPDVQIGQKNYPNIILNDYVSTSSHAHLHFSLTPNKANPRWVSIRNNDTLHIAAENINLEDNNTTQVIYITALNPQTGETSAADITIKILPNDQLPAPEWRSHVTLKEGIPGQSYALNLATLMDNNSLQDNDQLVFQLVSSPVAWLQIGDNGFSVIAKKIPLDAADKYYEITLRVTSKMSGKSNDLNARIYVNKVPQPPQWQPLPIATINRIYTLDLSKYVSSNIQNDQFVFQVNTSTLPSWLSIRDHRIISGTPDDTNTIMENSQVIDIAAKSLVTGMTSRASLSIRIVQDPKLAPQWKQNFFINPVIDTPYRSDDLMTVLENYYPHDHLSFQYVDGPKWLEFNNLCHCLASTGDVPHNIAGKSFTIKLSVYSKASGQTINYQQTVMVYAGVPHWIHTALPDVQIAQSDSPKIPLSEYTQNDISGDHFTYTLDQFHSPRWITLSVSDNQTFLNINPREISTNETGTVQTVRILATSQSTQKTSAQLLTINVNSNPNLPKPQWKSVPLSIATVGVAHVVDLSQYILGSLPNDRLSIRLSPDSPHWLSIQDNRLTGIPTRDQVGGPYPVKLIIYSQASGVKTTITTPISVQMTVVAGDNMETHTFYDNHLSIVIRGLQKNHRYHLATAKGSHFDYGPFYSPNAIKTGEDWDNSAFYAVDSDQTIQTGNDGVVSLVYYTLAGNPPPAFTQISLN